MRFDPWARKIPWRRKRQPTPVFLPGKSHRQKSLVGYSLWTGRVRHDLATKHHKLMLTLKNLDTTDNQKKKFKTCYSMAQKSPLMIFSFTFTLSTY